MKVNFTLVFLFLTLLLCGQNRKSEFVIIDYNVDGSIYQETSEQIDSISSKIDLYFYKKNFDKPYYLPERFIDNRYKNDTIIIWNNESDEKNFKSNWTNTYIYDSLSRVASYSYSGCFICSQLSYKYSLTYNKNDLPIRLLANYSSKDKYEMIYNDVGQIVELDYYSSDKLLMTIKKLK